MKEDPSEDAKHLQSIVEECLQKISEHVDSVQIFTTFKSTDGSGNTSFHSQGMGNYYAIRGQVQEWLVRQDQRVRNQTDEENREEEQ